MRRFVHNSLFRNLFLFCLIFALLGCATSQFSRRATNVGASPSPTTTAEIPQDQSDAISRPISKPYTGELSIFEDPKRDEKLQDRKSTTSELQSRENLVCRLLLE